MWFWGRGFCDAEKGKRDKERAVSGGFFGLLESVLIGIQGRMRIRAILKRSVVVSGWSRVYAYTGAFLESLGAVFGGAGKVVSKANQACLYFCGAFFARSKMVNTSTLNLFWGRFGRVGGLAGGSK
mgnify:CR=1 FL=1